MERGSQVLLSEETEHVGLHHEPAGTWSSWSWYIQGNEVKQDVLALNKPCLSEVGAF